MHPADLVSSAVAPAGPVLRDRAGDAIIEAHWSALELWTTCRAHRNAGRDLVACRPGKPEGPRPSWRPSPDSIRVGRWTVRIRARPSSGSGSKSERAPHARVARNVGRPCSSSPESHSPDEPDRRPNRLLHCIRGRSVRQSVDRSSESWPDPSRSLRPGAAPGACAAPGGGLHPRAGPPGEQPFAAAFCGKRQGPRQDSRTDRRGGGERP